MWNMFFPTEKPQKSMFCARTLPTALLKKDGAIKSCYKKKLIILFFKWDIPWTDRYIYARLIGEYNRQTILADIHRGKEEEVDDVQSDREKNNEYAG